MVLSTLSWKLDLLAGLSESCILNEKKMHCSGEIDYWRLLTQMGAEISNQNIRLDQFFWGKGPLEKCIKVSAKPINRLSPLRS